ncbi:MAG: ATP-dependent DNA helicase RecG [Betaproteobacteria bacterium]
MTAAAPRAARKSASKKPPRGAAAASPNRPPSPRSGWLVAYPALEDKLNKLDIRRPADLITHLPLRYEDHTRLTPLADVRPGVPCQLEGTVTATQIHYRPRRQLVTTLEQGDGQVVLRFLHFYPSQQKTLAPGKRIRAFGEPRVGFFGVELIHPTFNVVESGDALPDTLTPIYPTTAGLAQSALRKMILREIERSPELLHDTLPANLVERLRLPDYASAVRLLHQPGPDVSATALEERTHPAWMRLKFDELLAQQLSLKRHRRARQARTAPLLKAKGRLTDALLAQVGFALTGAQKRAWREIRVDLARRIPMHRLLQGDVGSGKTVVAALAALTAVDNGFQAVFMAPTEILAEQHFRKLVLWCTPLGINIAWLAGGQRAPHRRAALADCASGAAQIAVGTHALFQETVVLARLGLAIVDEQHRFGVAQRLALRGKGAADRTAVGGMAEPHQLMLSATPIPRTLAMSYFADLDVSVIDELPPGRSPVTTKLIAQRRRGEVIERVRTACAAGRQAYWVCPLIEESEKLQLQTALETHVMLAEALPEFVIGLLHGRMKADEKARVMAALVAGEIKVLVATTVIEVGVDVPNASLMVVEHAERFGLAQLHQLRGRVGRGAAESMCVLLFGEDLNPVAKARLKVIFETTDGFEIARQDLLIRGPGELLGARQSGVPMLRFADLERDVELLEIARGVADELLDDAPDVVDAHLDRWFGGREEFIRA